MNKGDTKIPGVNIQWPWSRMLVEGKKTVETRSYSLPASKENVTLAIIETPGPRGRRDAGIAKARIIGTIKFSGSFRYHSKTEWLKDHRRHQVEVGDPQFAFRGDREKWGWVVSEVRLLPKPLPAPARRGIVFAKDCAIS